jgi:hypothetical protein
LLSAIAAATGVVIYSFTRALTGRVLGAVAVLIWAITPVAVFSTTTFMAEALVTTLCVAAVASYCGYLARPGYRSAVSFGVFSALALLTKATAFSLVFVPPLAVLAARRLRLVRKAHFWAPLFVVIAIAGLWYVPLLRSSATRAQLETTLGLLDRLLLWPAAVGWLLCAAALYGLYQCCVAPYLRGGAPPWAAAAGSLVVGTTLTHLIVAESQEARHLAHAAPFVVVFGVVALGGRLEKLGGRLAPNRPAAARKVLVAATTLALLGGVTFRPLSRPSTPYARIAADLLADRTLDGSVILVSSDQLVEGPLIAELAARAPEPRHVVLRATKNLAQVSFAALSYRKRFASTAEIQEYLESIPVAAIVVDDPKPGSKYEHHRQLLELLGSKDSPWALRREYPTLSADGSRVLWRVRLYKLRGGDLRQRKAVEVEVSALGRTLRLEPPGE